MGEKNIKLLGTKLSPYSHRIEWALKLKGVEYELQLEDLKEKSPLLLELNPVYKKVPVLVHCGKAISESLIILECIDEIWKDENSILPKDPVERANARLLAKFVDEKGNRTAMYMLLRRLIVSANKALFSNGEEQVNALKSTSESLQILELEIEKNNRNLFGGERVGLLDIVLGWIYWFKFAEEISGLNVTNDSKKYPAINSWFNKFINDNVIKENLPPPSELYRVCQIMHSKWLDKIDSA